MKKFIRRILLKTLIAKVLEEESPLSELRGSTAFRGEAGQTDQRFAGEEGSAGGLCTVAENGTP